MCVVKAGETFEAQQCHQRKEVVVTNYAQKLGDDGYCQTCFDALIHRKQQD
ncbi:hypothetical protein [Acididesulfobacillus acetoxydans]|uniref:hypothetical protein n=1 Tax=Acididesulfobacillus acetoxydans TaxID=1561005 RepID=UPI001F0DBBDE|nr:hypothetical protein [Acididesulfobacillus acetoxydans]